VFYIRINEEKMHAIRVKEPKKIRTSSAYTKHSLITRRSLAMK